MRSNAIEGMRCKVCGRFLPKECVTATVGGKTLKFCCEACKDKFLKEEASRRK
ncbi:eL24 family ribosomal protein [Methanocella conradii]|uniref:hypothetical protein n=1 Tax=Methanocella conradii TaxID=1175444 RepID=UPI0013052682|nr:hypothetical protein [Methanocella conradii]MDI6895804.1 hypothetical protein [Methanocella conradii]